MYSAIISTANAMPAIIVYCFGIDTKINTNDVITLIKERAAMYDFNKSLSKICTLVFNQNHAFHESGVEVNAWLRFGINHEVSIV